MTMVTWVICETTGGNSNVSSDDVCTYYETHHCQLLVTGDEVLR